MRKKNIIRIALVTGTILLVPLVLTLTGSGVDGIGFHWEPDDFVFAGVLIFSTGLAYELLGKRSGQTAYRIAFGIGLAGAFLLIWVNAAVGVIGNENNPANLLYGAVLLTGFFGALIARFKPRGMAWTLFTAACIQLLVPVFALLVWPAQTLWSEAGMLRVFVLNGIFALLFFTSGLLFKRVHL